MYYFLKKYPKNCIPISNPRSHALEISARRKLVWKLMKRGFFMHWSKQEYGSTPGGVVNRMVRVWVSVCCNINFLNSYRRKKE